MHSNVEQAIAALEHCVETTASELDLVEQIDDGLQGLRDSYRRAKENFAPAELTRLWFASHIRDLAKDLMQVRQEIAAVRDDRDYRALESALVELEEGLRDTAIVARVRKELADFSGKSASLRATTEDLARAKAAARQREMQARADACQQGHRMVLRESSRGLFWGCSRYPACRSTRNLSEEERAWSK